MVPTSFTFARKSVIRRYIQGSQKVKNVDAGACILAFREKFINKCLSLIKLDNIDKQCPFKKLDNSGFQYTLQTCAPKLCPTDNQRSCVPVSGCQVIRKEIELW